MKIVVVGPTHPYKGGIAQHTTELAVRLTREGHDVVLQSWKRQYPARLYPGQLTVDGSHRDVAAFEQVRRTLTWYNPLTWVVAGRRAARADLVVVAHSNPFQVLAHLALLRCTGRRARPVRVIVAHNVLPHEPTAGARRLVKALSHAIDGVMVHSNEEAASAALHLDGVTAVQRPLPPFGPALVTATTRPAAHPDSASASRPEVIRLLALGFVRRYKGLDLLLEAARHAPSVTVTIRGECWDDELRRELEQLAALPELVGRVDLRTGYVDAHDIDQLFATHDLAVLPYLEATGSQNVLLAFTHGLPVLVSDLSTLSNAVTDSVDGKVLPVADTGAWAAALSSLTPATVAQWRANVTVPDSGTAWTDYCTALTSFSKVHQ